MGYQHREQREFQGIVDTRLGAGSPRWSCEDAINIDFSRRSIMGRAPLVKAVDEMFPAPAWRFNGDGVVQSDYAHDNLGGAEWPASSLNNFMRVYVSGLDLNRLSEWATGSRWCVASSTGDSTDFGDGGAGQTGGWGLFLVHNTQDNFRFEMHWEDAVTGSESLVVEGVDEDWADYNTVFCVEYSWNIANTEAKLEFYVDGSNSTTRTATAVLSSPDMAQSGSHYLNIGAVVPDDNLDELLYPFIGSIGPFTMGRNGLDSWYERWDWQVEESYSATTNNRYSSRWDILVHPSGENYEETPQGQDDYTNTQAGRFLVKPAPPRVSSGALELEPTNGLEVDSGNVNVDTTKALCFIMGFTVQAPPPGDQSIATSRLIAACGIDNASGRYFSLSVVAPGTTGYRITGEVSCRDQSDVVSAGSATTGDLAFGTPYRIALFAQANFDTAIDTTNVELWLETSGTWAQVATDTADGRPDGTGKLWLGKIPQWDNSVRLDVTDFRLHGNLDAVPTTVGQMATLDTYPPDGQLSWPSSVAMSFDFGVASSYKTYALPDGRAALLRISDNRFNNQFALPNPIYAENRHTGMTQVGSSKRPTHRGVWPGSENFGSQVKQTIDSMQSGAIWRYDVDSGTGKVMPGVTIQGNPTQAIDGVDYKDRHIYFGEGMDAVKAHPDCIARVGLNPPNWTFAAGSPPWPGSAGNGGLEESTEYEYRFSCYNSRTGQESNLSIDPENAAVLASTSAGQDTIEMTLTGFWQDRGDDWDTIIVYRKAQVSGLWHLEQRVPKPKVLPPEGPDIVITSSLAESDLLLQRVEEIDNHPPPPFSACAIAGRSMIIGGAGVHPGWAYYSKPTLHESFPPLNVWQLNDDDSDRVMSIQRVFGRIVIFKQRSIWATRDDAPETGEQPQLMHDGLGCVSSRGVTMADNRMFFVSPDRAVYATDGVEVADVSSASIRRTMDGFTVAQLRGIQLAHHARKKQLWMSVPETDGSRRNVYTFSYELGRWSRYEFPHDSISNGHEGEGVRGQEILVANQAQLFKQEVTADVIGAKDGDDIGGLTAADYWENRGTAQMIKDATNIYGVTWSTAVPAGFEGMPVIVAISTSGSFTWTDPKDHPFWRANTNLYFRTVRKAGSFVGNDVWFDEPIAEGTTGVDIAIFVGSQRRRYLGQWYSPQGEGMDYIFSGYSVVEDQNVDDRDFTFRSFVDQEASPIATYDATSHDALGLGPDFGFSMRRRGRRIQYEILSGTDRDQELHLQRVMLRYRIRGPRRVK